METASTIFEAELVEHRKPGHRHAGEIVPTVIDELIAETPSTVDLVVRRKDDGSEIVRTPADIASPEALLETAQNDLLHMTADEFLVEWKMPEIS